ncbi:MAG: hypothetical protein V1796_07755 [Pseudomonadota bacterium]
MRRFAQGGRWSKLSPAAVRVCDSSAPISVSEEHSMSNLRKSTAQAIEDFARMVNLIRSQANGQRTHLMGACSTAFGCSLQGVVAEEDVVRVALALREAGADAISLADTVGYANPEQVKRLFQKVRKAVGEDFNIEAHFHNTRGLGLVNALAAYEVGVHNFDSTLGGLGGCPWAAWAAVPGRRAPPVTWSPKTWCSCSSPWA